MFHAAHALVVERGFKLPKTHRGLQQLFARATSTEPVLQPLVAALSDSYRFKWVADYDTTGSTVTATEAQDAITEATSFIVTIRMALASPQTP